MNRNFNSKAISLALIVVCQSANAVKPVDSANFKLPVELINSIAMDNKPQSRDDVLVQQGVNGVKSNGGFELASPIENSSVQGSVDPAEDILRVVEAQQHGKPVEQEGFDRYGQELVQGTPYNEMTEKLKNSYKPSQRISITPGESVIVPVAQGLMNRIKTPFQMVAIKDSGNKDAIVDLDGGMVFVTINNFEPMSLMIYEEGVPESMFSIMLHPLDVPPAMIDTEITLTPEMINKGEAFRQQVEIDYKLDEADRLEHMQTQTSVHVKRIKEILAPVARGEVPRGFSFVNGDIPVTAQKPCSISIYQDAKQRMVGAREIVDVLLVANDSDRPYRVREQDCLMEDTIAVAILDKALLMPGEKTEVYILKDKLLERRKAQVQRRPRVTN